jgi:hypothetical protein
MRDVRVNAVRVGEWRIVAGWRDTILAGVGHSAVARKVVRCDEMLALSDTIDKSTRRLDAA